MEVTFCSGFETSYPTVRYSEAVGALQLGQTRTVAAVKYPGNRMTNMGSSSATPKSKLGARCVLLQQLEPPVVRGICRCIQIQILIHQRQGGNASVCETLTVAAGCG